MKTITKKRLMDLHNAGELKLLSGLVEVPKETMLEKLNSVKNNIQEYAKPTSRLCDIETTRDGYKTVSVYQSDDEDFIILEFLIDNSKCRTCSWDYKEVYSMAYLSC